VNPYPLLFSPLKVGSLELRNRIVMTPMGTNLADRQGQVSQAMIDYYAARARGGAGLIVVEGTAVHASGHGFALQLSASSDSHIEGLTRLARAIHQEGAAAILQLHHGGRNTDSRVSGRLPLGPSALRSPVGRITPEAMSLDQIELMVEAFGRAAERALEAGFDGVELHGAHEYLIHQFLTPYCNQRVDDYGGSLDNRMRFALQIVDRVRRRLGQGLLSIRFSGTDHVPKGLQLKDTVKMAGRLAQAGVDLLSVTGGVYETPHLLIPPMPIKHGTHLAEAAAIKAAVDKPVIGVGRINSPALAEEALKKNQADLIGCGRAFLADPDWPAKARAGDWPAIRRCVGCNQGCIDNFFADYPVTCLYNPQAGHERELAVRPTDSPKKVAVVGAGPGGLEAARVLDMMGHQVVLFEKSDRIGGQVNLAIRPPDKGDFKNVIDFYQKALSRSRVDLRLGVEARAETILDLKPQAVVVATGSVPLEPDLPGIRDNSVVTAHQVLAGSVTVGQKVVILGGGNIGLETAHLLLSQGRQVTVIEMGQQIGADLGPARRYLLMRRLRDLKLKRLVRCKIRRIHPDRVSYVRQQNDGQRLHQELTGVETVINAMGVRPLDTLALDLEDRHDHVLLVGDALNPGKILDAVSEGARAAHRIDAL